MALGYFVYAGFIKPAYNEEKNSQDLEETMSRCKFLNSAGQDVCKIQKKDFYQKDEFKSRKDILNFFEM